jgi:hypothetical protein
MKVCVNPALFTMLFLVALSQFHGVTKIFPNHRPKGLVLVPGRLNLTFREL